MKKQFVEAIERWMPRHQFIEDGARGRQHSQAQLSLGLHLPKCTRDTADVCSVDWAASTITYRRRPYRHLPSEPTALWKHRTQKCCRTTMDVPRTAWTHGGSGALSNGSDKREHPTRYRRTKDDHATTT